MKMRLLFFFTIIVFMLHAFGCSTIMNSKVDPKKIYKMQIGIETKNPDREYVGMAALPRKDLHTLEFTTNDDIGVLIFRTCSRQFTIEEPKKFLNKKKFVYNYRPNSIEAGIDCPAEIEAVNKNGLYSSGYLDFADQSTTLPAHNVCGSITEDTQGVSVCAEKVDSREQISFDVEVLTDPDKGCELESGNRGKTFEYKVKKGLCLYNFLETKPPYRKHRHTTKGHELIQFSI